MTTNLKDIIEDIDIFGKKYQNTDEKIVKQVYNQYIELIILEAPKSEQYNLYSRWSRVVQ